MNFSERLNDEQPILLDGAMGTLLHARGFKLPAPEWSAAMLEAQPDIITGLHREYIDAGVEMITTVTFRTTTRVYSKLKKTDFPRDLNRRAVTCARAAIGDREDVFIAGSVAPMEDCYRPDLVPAESDLREEHREQIEWLVDAGVDVLLFETMNSIREAAICSEVARELGFPFFTSLVCREPGILLSGESISDAVAAISEHQPLGILVNCTAPEILGETLEIVSAETDLPVGGYANVGFSEPEEGGTIEDVISPEEYAGQVSGWLRYDPVLLGACCGSSPAHIAALRELIDS